MRIENLYSLADEMANDLMMSEEFSVSEKKLIMNAVHVFISTIAQEEFDLGYIFKKKNEILQGVPPKSIRSRAVVSFYNDIEIFSEQEAEFKESYEAV